MAYSRHLSVLILVFTLSLTACGGSGGDVPPEPEDPGADPEPGSGSGSDDDEEATYSVGGSVTGMSGSGLVISNNGSDELTLDASGSFVFAVELADGAGYDIAVMTQPTAPDAACTVENGSGAVNGADVTDVEIICSAALSLLDAAPAEDDQDVSRTVEPVLTFSADVDSATVVTGNITLASSAGEVDVTFDVSGDMVTLSPDNLLLPLTEYTLTVTTDVLGSGGERLPEPATVSFRTSDASWQADIEVDAASGSANHAQIAFDADGNALAVWSQDNGSGSDIWWNDFTAGVGWSTAAPIEQNGADVIAGSPQIGFDSAGNALAVWTLHDDAADITSVRGSRFVAGTGWSTPEFIETDPGDVFGGVDMAVNQSGDAVAVWVQFDGTFMNLWSSRFTVGSGWGTPEIIDETDDVVESPRVAINDSGDALVVWPMRTISNFAWDVWARRYTEANGWGASTLVSTSNSFEAVSPRPVMDGDGNALVIWVQGLGLETGLYASRYTAAGGWENPTELSVSESIEGPELAIDPDGNAMAVWEQSEDVNGVLEMVAYAGRFTPAGWETPERISNRTAFYPDVGLDASGHAVAAWFELDTSLPGADAYSVWSNRYINGTGWTGTEQIGSNGGLIGTGMPNVAVGPSGNAFAIWTRGGEVRVNRFE